MSKLFVLLASALVLTGVFPASAKADVIEGIVPGSVKIVPWNGDPGQPVYLWDGVKVEAKWAIPDQSGKAGDQFKLGLPDKLAGFASTFDLKGDEGDPLTYGTCEVSSEELVCTLNDNVVGKNDVGGDLWLAVQTVDTFTEDELEFTYGNNGTVTVPWINGIDVGYRPAPGETVKEGWTTDTVENGVFWRVAVRGSDLAGATSTTITDTFAMAGLNFTVAPGYPQVYTLKTTDKCWSLQYSDDCRVDLNEGTTPSATTTIDEDADVVTATINAPDGFDPNTWYAMDLLVSTDKQIKVGDTFNNKAEAGGKQLTATAEKVEAGAGTGRGTTPTPPPPPVPPTKTVVPVSPKVTPGVCKPGDDVPSEPTVEVATTEGIEYSAPVVRTEGSTVTVTVKAAAKSGFKIDENALPEGWSVVGGEIVFTWTGQAAPCAKPTPTPTPSTPAPSPSTPTPSAPAPSPSTPTPSTPAPSKPGKPGKPTPPKPSPVKPGLPKTGA